MEQYNIDNVTESELKLGYWLATHRLLLKRSLLGFLILTTAVFWGLTFYGLIVYLSGLPEDARLVQSIIDNSVDFSLIRQQRQFADLQFSAAQVIYTGSNKYDILAQVTNPNNNLGVARLAYAFEADDFTTATFTISILPGQTIYLMSLANESARRLARVNLKIGQLIWQSRRDKTQIIQADFAVDRPTVSQADDGSGRVSFMVVNQTPSNFWQASFQVLLFSSSQLVGVNQITVDQFLAGELRPIDISWFEKLPRVSRAEIIPVIDVLDQNNYFKVPGQPTDF